MWLFSPLCVLQGWCCQAVWRLSFVCVARMVLQGCVTVLSIVCVARMVLQGCDFYSLCVLQGQLTINLMKIKFGWDFLVCSIDYCICREKDQLPTFNQTETEAPAWAHTIFANATICISQQTEQSRKSWHGYIYVPTCTCYGLFLHCWFCLLTVVNSWHMRTHTSTHTEERNALSDVRSQQ